MPRTAQNQTTMKTLRTIQTEWARTALWEMAEYLPGMLLRMYREEPRELVTWIEETVDKALDWKKAVLANGSDPQLVEELFRERLKPDYCPEEPEPITISEEQMAEIVADLEKIAETM